MLIILLQILVRSHQNLITGLLDHDVEVIAKGLKEDDVARANGSGSEIETSHGAEVDMILVGGADVDCPDRVPLGEGFDHDGLAVIDIAFGVGEAGLWRDLVSLCENGKGGGGNLRMKRSSRGTRQHLGDGCHQASGLGYRSWVGEEELG